MIWYDLLEESQCQEQQFDRWVHGLWQRRAGHHLTMGSFKTSSLTSFSARSSVSSSPLSPLSERPEALAVEQEVARITHEEYLSLSPEEWIQRLQKHNVVLAADVLSFVDRAALLRNIYIYFMKSQRVETKVPTAIRAQYLFLHDVARQPSLRLSRQEITIKLRISIRSLHDLRKRLMRFLTHYPSELGTEGLLSYDAHLYESPGKLTLDQLHKRTGRYREAFLSGDFQLKLPLDIKSRLESYMSSQDSRGTFLHNMQRTFARGRRVVVQDGPVRALKHQFVLFTLMTDIQPLSPSKVATLLGITPNATQILFIRSLKTFLRDYDDPLLAQEDEAQATLKEPSLASFSRSASHIEFSPHKGKYQRRIDPKVRELKQLKEQYFALSQDQWIAKMSALTGAGSQSIISSSPRDLLQDLSHFFQKETSYKYSAHTAQLLFLRRLFEVQEAPLPPLSKGYEKHISAFLERHSQQQQSEAQRAYEDLTRAFLDESHHSYSQVESLLLSLVPEPLAHSQKARELLLAVMEKSPTYVVHYFLAHELQLHSSLSREDMKSYYGVPKPPEASLAALRQRLARLTRFHFETFPTSVQELELFLQKHWQNTLDGMYNRELTALYHLAPESIDQFLDHLKSAIISFAEVPPTTEVPPTRERILERQYVSLWHLLGWKGAASRDLAAQILGMPVTGNASSRRVSENIRTALHGLSRTFSDANALYEFQVSHLKHIALMEHDQLKSFDYRVNLQDQQTLEESVGLYFTQNPELYESSISRSLFLASLDLPVISHEDLARIFDTSEEDIAQRLLTYRQHWLSSHLISSVQPRSYHELVRDLKHLPKGTWEQLRRKWWGQGQGSVEDFEDLVMKFFQTYGGTNPLRGHVFLALVLKMEQPSRSTKLAIIREHRKRFRPHRYIPIAGPTENLQSVQARQRSALLAFQEHLEKTPIGHRTIDTVEQIRSITMAAFKNISSEQTRALAAQWGAQYHDQPERVELWRERMLTFGAHLLANHPDDFDLFITRVLGLTHIDKASYVATTGKPVNSIYLRARRIHTHFKTYLQEGLFSQR